MSPTHSPDPHRSPQEACDPQRAGLADGAQYFALAAKRRAR
jgi:hypothetical protein